MNKRIIRDEFDQKQTNNFKSKEIVNLQPNEYLLHPATLTWTKNTNTTNPICLTKFQIDKKNNLNFFNEYKCKSNINNYNKNLYIPPIGLESSDLLNIYSIESIDSLYSWFLENFKKTNYLTINRVLNSWIRVNFETLKNYNNYLEKIYSKVTEYNFKDDKNYINNQTDINKEIGSFIDYWIGKHSSNEFDLNLLENLNHHLKKKFNLYFY